MSAFEHPGRYVLRKMSFAPARCPPSEGVVPSLTFRVLPMKLRTSDTASDRFEDLGRRLRFSFFFWHARPAPESQYAAHREVTTRDAGNSFSTGVSPDGTYHRYREVVQRREGLWFHHARERREGLLRASHRY